MKTQELIEREKELLNTVKDLKASINHEKRMQNLFTLRSVKIRAAPQGTN